MTADDVYGSTIIFPSGLEDSSAAYRRKRPFNWVIYYEYRENDGWTFMRNGPQRRVSIRINPDVSPNTVENAVEAWRKNNDRDSSVSKLLEKMLKSGKLLQEELEEQLR